MGTDGWNLHKSAVDKFWYNSPTSNPSDYWSDICGQSDRYGKHSRYTFATYCCKHTKNGVCLVIQYVFLYLMFSLILISQGRNGWRFVFITSSNAPKHDQTCPWLTIHTHTTHWPAYIGDVRAWVTLQICCNDFQIHIWIQFYFSQINSQQCFSPIACNKYVPKSSSILPMRPVTY